MKVKYTEKGKRGKTCKECGHFISHKTNTKYGKCFGHDVPNEASCNFFRRKKNLLF